MVKSGIIFKGKPSPFSFLIAQDVQKVLPEAVDVEENENKTLRLRYTDLIPLLVASIQEQQSIIDSQEERLAKLESLLSK